MNNVFIVYYKLKTEVQLIANEEHAKRIVKATYDYETQQGWDHLKVSYRSIGINVVINSDEDSNIFPILLD